MLRSILLSALLAGLVAGLVLTAVQRYEVVPIILEAESYEAVAPQAHAHDGATGETSGAPAASPAAEREPWAPEDGIERTFWTAVGNSGVGIGFALLLCAAYAWRGRVELREGVLWGIAGFIVFFVNPSFGLQPEIPGAAAADLGARQLWWIGTVICTAAGLWLLAFRRQWTAALAGAALLLVPHAVGAPHVPPGAGAAAPVELTHAFVGAAYLANAIFWVVLGLATALCFTRFVPDNDAGA